MGVASLALGGYVARDALAPVWVTWWLGDTVGALTVTPFLLLWRESGSQRWTSARLAEAAGVCAAVLFVAAAVFGRPLFQDAGGSPLAYLALLPVLWAALRFGARETVTVILLLSGVAIAGTLQGWGPFVNDTRNSSLLHLQSFLGVATLIGLFLSTVRREQAARWDELERRVDERTGELELAYERAQVHAQRLCDMMDCLTVAAVAADEGLRVLHVNDCFRRLFNLESDPAEGVPIARILERVTPAFAEPQETMDLFRCWLRDLRPARRPELALADGRLLACEYIPTVSRRKDRGHLLVLRDVTEERRVDRAKSEFMSLASHQLRTPLTGIRWSLGRLERLLRDRLLEPERRLLSDGRQAAARMGETIDRMLAIARMESRQRSAQPQEAGLAELLEAAAADSRRAAEAKGQALAIHCQDGLVLRTDPKLLGEIVGNLLGNAVKYTPPGGRIALRVTSASGTVRIAVEDSGIGIPADEQSSVFRKFFRAENARTLDQEGTGLGLYFAAGAARLLGARLSFTSLPGRGTVFTLEHPAGPLSAQPERHKREPVVV